MLKIIFRTLGKFEFKGTEVQQIIVSKSLTLSYSLFQDFHWKTYAKTNWAKRNVKNWRERIRARDVKRNPPRRNVWRLVDYVKVVLKECVSRVRGNWRIPSKSWELEAISHWCLKEKPKDMEDIAPTNAMLMPLTMKYKEK